MQADSKVHILTHNLHYFSSPRLLLIGWNYMSPFSSFLVETLSILRLEFQNDLPLDFPASLYTEVFLIANLTNHIKPLYFWSKPFNDNT